MGTSLDVPKNDVTASTLVLAAIRDRVAALHAAVEPEVEPELEVAGVDDDDAGSSVTVPAAPEEVPDASAASAASGDDEIDVERLADAVADLEAVVTGFGPLIEGDDVGALRSELAWARSTLAAARELDATIELLEELVEDLDPTLRQGPVDARLGIVTAARTSEQRAAVTAMLAQPEWASLLHHADQLVLTAPISGRKPKQAASVLGGALAAVDDEAREQVASVVTETEARVDEVARAAEAVAVTARVTRAVHGKHARKLADAADDLAAALGERRQAEAAARWLVDLADLAHRAGEPGFTYGVLHTVARARRAEADEAVAAAVTAYAKPKLHKWLVDT